MAKQNVKLQGLNKVLWYRMEGVQNPEAWLEANKGKDRQTRYEKRVEIKEMLKHKTPSNPSTSEGPMVASGYDNASMVLVSINEDGSLGWLLPIQSHTDKSVTLLTGEVIEVDSEGYLISTQPAEKTWAEVASEVKIQRAAEKAQKQAEKVEYKILNPCFPQGNRGLTMLNNPSLYKVMGKYFTHLKSRE